jgi:hypothetical protein
VCQRTQPTDTRSSSCRSETKSGMDWLREMISKSANLTLSVTVRPRVPLSWQCRQTLSISGCSSDSIGSNSVRSVAKVFSAPTDFRTRLALTSRSSTPRDDSLTLTRSAAGTGHETCRNAVCALEAHLAARSVAIARAMRCPVRVHAGGDCAEPPQAGQVGRPAATIRLFVRCVSVASVSKVERKSPALSSG